jgi:hypothetical protein
MLSLTPANNYDPKIIILGGNSPATATTEIIDMGAGAPTWVYGPDMSQARVEMDAVMLPNGKVLALGGSANDEVATTASLNADLYDPNTNSFSSAGQNVYARLYHTTALLLPDATVWLAGGNPARGTYEHHMEIYKPAYLFARDGNNNVVAATRPTISSTPANVTWGGQFTVSTPDAASISQAVLVRTGSSTHAFDMDQRLVGMNFTAGSSSLTVTAPPNSKIAPAGYYMLFLLNSAGVPSVAKFVLLNGTGNPAPTVSSISPSSGTANGGTPVTITGTGFLAGATVKLGGTSATGVSVNSSTSITATTAAHSAGTVDVVVTNSDSRSGTVANGYTYLNPAPTVSSISPRSGTANGATPVTITGTGFLAGATVKLGGTSATGVSVNSSTSITATTAAHSAGTVDVVVTNSDSRSGTVANGYTYFNPSLGLGAPSGDSVSETIVAGQTASYTLAIGGAGMSGPASLSCAGAPRGANCSVPASQSLSSTLPATFGVSVTTTSSAMAALHPPSFWSVPWLWTMVALGMVVGPGLRVVGPKFLQRALLMLLVLLVACGGGGSSVRSQSNPNGTPAGTYTLSVTATSGSTTQAMSLRLIVQ